MDLSNVIIGPVVTEKAERLKTAATHTYSLRVDPAANKIDIKKAIKRFYDLDVVSVRIQWVRPKTRQLGAHAVMEKRHRMKKALVTLAPKSKPLDLSAFHTA